VVQLTWAAFRANASHLREHGSTITALLPLFRHSANTTAMIKHGLVVVQRLVHHLNTAQTPVVMFDQPLYALAKQIQWHWLVSFGEDKFVILLGGLHIEMATLRLLGHWLNGCGWVQSLTQAGVATSGVAESFINATHVKRTRYAHTVTAAALYICMKQSYTLYCEQQLDNETVDFDEWRAECVNSSVQFRFWNTVLELELLLLAFVRSLTEGNFTLYVDSLQQLAPWFFALDQTNYAGWLSVHLRDMLLLQSNHSNIFKEFMVGNFTVSKSHSQFSAMSIDQAHEQLNALLKGDGGVVGLTENDAALNRWIVATCRSRNLAFIARI